MGCGGCGGEAICHQKVQQSFLNQSLDTPPHHPQLKIPGSAPGLSSLKTILSSLKQCYKVPTRFKQIYDITNAEQLLRLVNSLHQRWHNMRNKIYPFCQIVKAQHNAIKFHSSVRQKSMRNAQGHGNYTCAQNFWSFSCRMTCKHFLLPFVVNISNYFILHPWIQEHFRDLLSNSRTRSLSPLPGLLRLIEPIYHLPLYTLIFPRQTFLSPLSCLVQQQPRNFNQTNLHKNFRLTPASFLCFTKLTEKSFSSERRIKRNTLNAA